MSHITGNLRGCDEGLFCWLDSKFFGAHVELLNQVERNCGVEFICLIASTCRLVLTQMRVGEVKSVRLDPCGPVNICCRGTTWIPEQCIKNLPLIYPFVQGGKKGFYKLDFRTWHMPIFIDPVPSFSVLVDRRSSIGAWVKPLMMCMYEIYPPKRSKK